MRISVLTPTIRPAGLEIVKECLKRQTFTDFEWVTEVGLGIEHDLNQAWNRMIKRANGELVVFYQDFIKIGDDGLEKFWKQYQKDDGNVMYTAPVGKVDKWEDNPRWDWRFHRKNADVSYNECEMDWGASPVWILRDVGGFDETLDKYWSFDNPNLCFRASQRGITFKNLDNDAIALDHDKFMEHPFRDRYNPKYHNERMREFESGKKINYLK